MQNQIAAIADAKADKTADANEENVGDRGSTDPTGQIVDYNADVEPVELDDGSRHAVATESDFNDKTDDNQNDASKFQPEYDSETSSEWDKHRIVNHPVYVPRFDVACFLYMKYLL